MISSVIYPSKAVFRDTQLEENTQVSGETEKTEPKTPKSADFDALLRGVLNKQDADQVSEEELFAASVMERITTLKDTDAAEAYQTELDTQRTALKKADGFIPHEQAAINALKGLVSQGKLTQEEGDKIYSQAFAAAQLDSNQTCLYDDRGGGNDPTIAVAKMEAAMAGIRALIEKIDGGNEEVAALSLASASQTGSAGAVSTAGAQVSGVSPAGQGTIVTPNGTVVDGSEGFLFKPITNNQNRLAVLLGQKDAGIVATVSLRDQAGNLIESGVLSTAGRAETGRDKWNFSKQGGDYPKDLVVEVVYNDGTIKNYAIPDPSRRYD